jgi:hypothetical protein
MEREFVYNTYMDMWAIQVGADLIAFISEEQDDVKRWQIQKSVIELQEERSSSSSDEDWDEEVPESGSSDSDHDSDVDRVLLPGTTTRSGLILRYHPYKI